MAILTVSLTDTINQFREDFNTLATQLGDVSVLTIPVSNIVDALNSIDSDLGSISTLTFTASTIVDALNTLDSNLTAVDSNLNIVDSNLTTLSTQVGNIALLNVAASNIVDALNIIDSAASNASLSITNDSSTNSSFYITLTEQTTGFENALKVSSAKLYFNPSTGILNSTDFNSLSDTNYKENVVSLVDSINIINQINPVSFTWKSNGKAAFGVIAQEIEQILPELVSTNEHGVKSVSYTQLIPFIINAIQQHEKQIQQLTANQCKCNN